MNKKLLDQNPSLKFRSLYFSLARVHPGCGYVPWFKALRAIHHETGGSEKGFELVDSWSSQGHNYKGSEDVRKHWNSIKPGARPITAKSIAWIAKLLNMAYGVRR
jgi:hypothetical protein